MHFVAALDRVDGMRCILGLFEGVVTGAADGYARMLDRPAATLLHLGPGLANGLSNLHNAIRAFSPVVNVIGDHATYHRHYDAPLTSDIEAPHAPSATGCARRRTPTWWQSTAPPQCRGAYAPGRIASLILPGDAAWSEVTDPLPGGVALLPVVCPARGTPSRCRRRGEIAALRRDDGVCAGGSRNARKHARARRQDRRSDRREALRSYAQRAHYPRRRARSGNAIPYAPAQALETFKEVKNIILIAARRRSDSSPIPTSRANSSRRAPASTRWPASMRTFPMRFRRSPMRSRRRDGGSGCQVLYFRSGHGRYHAGKLGALIAATLPENAIVVDESITTGRTFMTAARPHGRMTGSCRRAARSAMPCRSPVGAAVACPDRKVSASKATAAACTCRNRCGRRRGKD